MGYAFELEIDADLDDLFEAYQRLIGDALDELTIESIRQLVREIEAELAKNRH